MPGAPTRRPAASVRGASSLVERASSLDLLFITGIELAQVDHSVEETVSMPRFGRSIDHRRHGGDPRFFDVAEQKLGGAEDVEPGELEVEPCGPAVGVALEQIDLGGEHVEPDHLLLSVEPRPTIAVFDPQAILGLPLLPLADCLLPAIPRAAGILGDLEQRLLQIEL